MSDETRPGSGVPAAVPPDAGNAAPGPGTAAAAAVDVAIAIESTVSRVLVAGTYLAMGLVLVGVLGTLAAGIDPFATGFPPFDLRAIPAEMLAGEPEGFLWAGLVTVLVLPIGRVIVSGIGFLAAHDRRLALVSLAVLLVVSASVLAAIGLEG